MSQRVVASIEARMGSSRLPGKVLADVQGVPALTRLLRRLRACRRLDDVVLATSTSSADDALEAWARSESVAVSRGSEDDVLRRVVDAQARMKSDIVVEITGDCPLLDPELVDLAVETFFANACDVVTNVRVPSFPQGADFQVFRQRDLAHVADTIDDPAVREHVSMYFYEHPERYRIIHVLAPSALRAPDLRLQLDYPEDLEFIREVYARLEPTLGGTFGVPAILDLLKREPALARINADCEEKPVR
jgi:spore coat polysaccharide biosynthesis protein SpsF